MAIISTGQVEHMSVDSMQEIHEKEIKLINEIDYLANKRLEGKTDIKELEVKLDSYIDNVKEHFELEEELMEKYDFPSIDIHELAHQMFMADLSYTIRQWKEFKKVEPIIKFVRKSTEWFEMHATTVDMPTANYIAKKQSLQNNA